MSAASLIEQIREKIIFTYSGTVDDTLQMRSERVENFVNYLQQAIQYGDSSQIDPFLDQCLAQNKIAQGAKLPEEINLLLLRLVLQTSLPDQSRLLLAVFLNNK